MSLYSDYPDYSDRRHESIGRRETLADVSPWQPDPDLEPSIADEPTDLYSEEDEAYTWRPRVRDPKGAGRRGRAPVFRDATESPFGRIETPEGENDAPGLPMTYRPARFEALWLTSSLRSFYDQELIVDVLAQVKGGKEANVYRCRAHEHIGGGLVAAKVYRPRQLRNLANDRLYRDGRPVLTADGKPVKTTDHRIMRAIGKKTAFGLQVKHTSWLMYEYTTLEQLRRDGAAVPEPYGSNENAILMGYRGDERRAAPTLHEVRLGRREARSLFDDVHRNVELLLAHGLVHGDLSAYNVLYWEGAITLIDFPQVTSIHGNPSARAILERDVRRICEYFARQGVRSDPARLAADLWDRHGALDYPEPTGLDDLDDDIDGLDESEDEEE